MQGLAATGKLRVAGSGPRDCLGHPRMSTPQEPHTELNQLIAFCPDLAAWAVDAEICDPAALVDLYERLLPEVEARMWRAQQADFDAWLARYQALHRELQALIEASGEFAQHDFLLAVTVADRPAHVRTCLASILAQCECYGYGGRDTSGHYAKVTVVLAEDSREPANVEAHRALAAEFDARGLRVIHFDLPEQFALLHALPAAQRARLGRLLTEQPAERFWRKGQAANRNLAYLKLLQLTRDRANTLYYLVDSDQAFAVNIDTPGGERVVPAFSVFHTIDRLFRTHDIRMLTGKLVGDPPVSPAVMAANFLADVAAFLDQIAALDPEAACSFHGGDAPSPGEAAYHDHAPLFGLGAQAQHFDYRCPLAGPHDHAACLDRFSRRLEHFFFGEHLTRRTQYEYAGPVALTPARTVYPGNYIVDYAGLKYLIPFGHLRLRMSGPTAGRLIQAEIGARFASSNLPMLHRRTARGDAVDEFRPGVDAQAGLIDIGDEFERQFFGDLMLFSVVEWLKTFDLAALATHAALPEVVERVEAELLTRYADKLGAVAERRTQIARWLAGARVAGRDAAALERVARFLANIEANFGEAAPAWRLIRSEAHRAARRAQIIDALRNYRAERDAWDALF